jgi:hypothetical protein
LFSAIVTAFVILSYSNLQENYSQDSANALYYLSRQMSDSSLPPLPPRAAFVAGSSDIRVNAVWLSSLVVSLVSAWLSIVVKGWIREYMSWTKLVPGPHTLALRQYRANARRRWHVRRWRDAIPLLLQLALLLFFWGLLDLLWNTQSAIAALVTTLVVLSVVIVLGASVIASWTLDCPYRTPVSWLVKHMTHASCHVGNMCKNIVLAMISIPSRRQPVFSYFRTFGLSKNPVSWDYLDASHLDVPSRSRPYMIRALGEAMAITLSPLALDTAFSPLYDTTTPVPLIPMRDLWTLLRKLLGGNVGPDREVLRSLQDANPDELNSLCSFPPDLLRTIVGLTRRAAWRQDLSNAQNMQATEDVLDLVGVICKVSPLVAAYHATTLVSLLNSPLSSLAAKHLRWFATHAVNPHSRATMWSGWNPKGTCLS